MLTSRTLRNLWHRVEGVFTKYVNRDDADLDSIDFTDELETNQAISSAAFEDVSGVTLGTPSIAAGVVQFTHTGAGSAVLQVVLDFAAYIASLFTGPYLFSGTPSYRAQISCNTGGAGAAAGAAVDVVVWTIPDGSYITNLEGRALRSSLVGENVDLVLGAWDPVLLVYAAVLITACSAASDNEISVSYVLFTDLPTMTSHDLYAAKPTRTLHRKLAFTDPSSPDTDYTP